MTQPHTIRDWMKREVISAPPEATLAEAAALIVEKKVGTLPVVDAEGVLVGVATITDIIHIFLPDFVSLMGDIDFVKDYGNMETPSPEDLERAKSLHIYDVMKEPVAVEDNCSLVRALSVMEKHDLPDLPVVKEGRLVGIASQVDIGRSFLTDWMREPEVSPAE